MDHEPRLADWKTSPPPTSRQPRILAATVGLLAVYNYLSNRVLPAWAYVPANAAMSGIMLGLGRAADLQWDEMGLKRDRLGSGIRWGVGSVVVVGVGIAALAVIPAFRSFFVDQRVAEASSAEAAYQILVRIPFGTAVFEEVAFRGVLLGLLLRLSSPLGAVAVSSGLFGLWHIVPTLDALDVSPVVETTGDALGVGGSLTAAVVATTAAGFIFSWLRLRSGSLLAPILAHGATNSLSYLAAYVVIRNG